MRRALRFNRNELAKVKAADPNAASTAGQKARIVAVQRDIRDARDLNAEVAALFPEYDLQLFDEVRTYEIDYRAALPVFEKWMKRLDNVSLVGTLTHLAIPYVNAIDEPDNSRLIDTLVETFTRMSTFVRHPELQAQIVGHALRDFAGRMVSSQADILLSLCEAFPTDNALCIYLVERLSQLKDLRAKAYLGNLLADEQFWVVNVAIDFCRRLRAKEFVGELQAVSDGFPSPKVRAKAAKCILLLDTSKPQKA